MTMISPQHPTQMSHHSHSSAHFFWLGALAGSSSLRFQVFQRAFHSPSLVCRFSKQFSGQLTYPLNAPQVFSVPPPKAIPAPVRTPVLEAGESTARFGMTTSGVAPALTALYFTYVCQGTSLTGLTACEPIPSGTLRTANHYGSGPKVYALILAAGMYPGLGSTTTVLRCAEQLECANRLLLRHQQRLLRRMFGWTGGDCLPVLV